MSNGKSRITRIQNITSIYIVYLLVFTFELSFDYQNTFTAIEEHTCILSLRKHSAKYLIFWINQNIVIMNTEKGER